MATPPSPPARFLVRSDIQAGGFYLHVEDLASGLIGPFPDVSAAASYYTECKERGDGAAFMAIYPGSSPLLNDVLEHALLATVEQDRKFAAEVAAELNSLPTNELP